MFIAQSELRLVQQHGFLRTSSVYWKQRYGVSRNTIVIITLSRPVRREGGRGWGEEGAILA